MASFILGPEFKQKGGQFKKYQEVGRTSPSAELKVPCQSCSWLIQYRRGETRLQDHNSHEQLYQIK